MPYTVAGKNVMLTALGAVASHIGLFTKTLITGVTGVASTDIFTKASHGLSNGDLVLLLDESLAGGEGLFEEIPYYVVGVSGDDFQLSHTVGGAAVNFTTNVTDVTLKKYVEISGGSPAYARKAIAWDTPALGSMDDTTNGAAFDVPAGAQVNAVGAWSASTNGTLYQIDDVTEETFAGQGTYTVTDGDLNLNGDWVAG